MFLRLIIRTALHSGLCLLLNVLPMHTPAQASADMPQTVLVLGDSISAGYGMTLEQGWVALLDDRLAQQSPPWQAVNASISGDTTGGGLRRLPALLAKHRPQIVIIELGGNDGLRGYPIKQLRQNLATMTKLSRDSKARVLILGMEIPPNFGERYTQLFRAAFTDVAASEQATYGGFMLAGVATNSALMQADGIHPTAEAQRLLLDNVWPHLLTQLSDLSTGAQQ